MLRRCIVLVQLYSSMGRASAVGSLLRHITRVQPGHPEHLAEYARWLHRSGREWESFGFYQRTLRVSPRHVSALVGSARALRSRGHHARARIFLQRALVVQREVYGSSAWHRAISEPTLHINPHLYTLQQEKTAEQEKPVAFDCHKVSCAAARRLLGGVHRAGLLNRTRDVPGCLQPCSPPAAAAAAPTEELVPAASTTPDLGVFSAAHSTGTAAFNQGYHYSHWSPQGHLHAVVAPVEPTLLALPGPEVIQGSTSCVTGECTGLEDEITG
ncbi:hypothetical protein B566_EDAN001205 [Ephemera danica]|nr:hypothetical protein B566_EDAN001205 [Ephemera danica]